jgi:isoquinoline 1-oxidoreductase alpha subunit
MEPAEMITLVINGRTVTVDCAPEKPLLHAIRSGGPAGLAATPSGCLIGMCGACVVHLDGQPVRSCEVTLEQVQGRAITTLEGLLDTTLGRVLAQAWTQHAVSPCGRCSPGQIMTAAALLAQNPAPSGDDIDAALANHACDCDERGDLHVAILDAARTLAA